MNRRWCLRLTIAGLAACVALAVEYRHEWLPKRVVVLAPGRLVRGAWQRPGPLRALIEREGVRTIVTLTAINTDDPKYVDQRRVVDETGVAWIIVPMRGSTATLDQLAEAADLLAEPARQPVFFHCVAGHHRTNLAHAAYLVRHEGWSADRAWRKLCTFPWTRPEADEDDRRLIEAFADLQKIAGDGPEEPPDDSKTTGTPGHHGGLGTDPLDRGARRLAMGDGQRRRRAAR